LLTGPLKGNNIFHFVAIFCVQVMIVSEIFAKQLMQLSGVSPDKAVAILEKYSTPKRYRGEFLSRQTFNFM